MTYADFLIRKDKRGAAAFVQAECLNAKNEPSKNPPAHLNALLDHLLNPEKSIGDGDMIDWCRWLIGGGSSYEDFAANVREYDTTAMCGLVWTADFVAYRCRTCGISQCMSLCQDCFRLGNHEGHDYNMFKSQAGGACDCGDSSVMKESGFCVRHHGSRAPPVTRTPPDDLMVVAENIVPRIILRLLQHLRINTVHSEMQLTSAQALEKYEQVIEDAKFLLKLLHDFSSLGAAMRTVLTRALVDMQSYERLTNVNEDSEYASFMRRSRELYLDALRSLPNPDPPAELQDCQALTARLQHRTFLEELVFWTVKYEFPERLVCLMLKMLPDGDYKEAFTRSFVLHYSRVSMMLVRSSNSDKLSNRVVHVSVQLFSNEELALAMTESLSLLHIMVSSLRNMMSGVLIASEMNEFASRHMVVDCSKHVMRDHCYWPLVSDLNNVLSHPPIAFRFMSDNTLLTMWFDFLKMFQGMNLNVRIGGAHIEFEPNTYYASFSGELEASASPMWALVSHIKPDTSREYSENILRHCLSAIKEWMDTVNFTDPDMIDPSKASFHIPLHRYYAVFLRQAVKAQGFSLRELLPDNRMLTLMMQHPLRVQTAFYEIMSSMWVRNGLQIKGQAMTYIQCHFCKSMVDADLFLLQVCATQLPTKQFINNVIERFQVQSWLSISRVKPRWPTRVYRDNEQELQMVESCLVFLVSLLTLRTNLGLSEETLARLEMVSLLCMGDKTHSMLFEHMPEKCGATVPLELFDKVLSEVAQYSEPRFEGGNMQQGMYLPRPSVWEELYDPIYVQLRAVHRREFQTSIERFSAFARERFQNDPQRLKTVQSPWPPFRLPPKGDEGFEDPRKILHSKFMHGLIFNLLYKSVHCDDKSVSDLVTSYAVHLLELAVTFPQTEGALSGKEVAVSKPWLMANEPVDLEYDTWFPTDCLVSNIKQVVSVIFSEPPSDRSGGGAGAGEAGDAGRDGGGEVAQSMEVDVVSDVSDSDDAGSSSYQVETPSSITMEESSSGPSFPTTSAPSNPSTSSPGAPAGFSLQYNQPLALTGPPYQGSTAVVPSSGQHPSSAQPTQPRMASHTMPYQQRALAPRTITDVVRVPPYVYNVGPHFRVIRNESGAHQSTSAAGAQPSSSSNPSHSTATVTIVNESMISLLLRLHSKYSGRLDSYVPLDERSGWSVTKEYRESRIGDACFFIEKVLDRICEKDAGCRAAVDCARKQLWPDYHATEAKKDEEQEKREAEEKKQRARMRQKKMMEEMAKQRKRFMEANAMKVESGGDKSQSEAPVNMDESSGDATASPEGQQQEEKKEYTCCHCLATGPASEDRPIGLVALAQSTSVLAHRHHKTSHLSLPTSGDGDNDLRRAFESSLGAEFADRLQELKLLFGPGSALLSVNSSWRGGIHVQSCGHHMHYDCRQSYCETLKQQVRVSRDQQLDTDHGEFICPMCRQMANALLPVPPEPPCLPAAVFPKETSERMAVISEKIWKILTEEAVHLRPGATSLRSEMSRVMEFLTQTTLPKYRLGKTEVPKHAIAHFIGSIARTNLECDLVQRGGTLVDEAVIAAELGAAAAASSSTLGASGSSSSSLSSAGANVHVNKPKSCFIPLMHVLSIHLNAMQPETLSDQWSLLCGKMGRKDVALGSVSSGSSDTRVQIPRRQAVAGDADPGSDEPGADSSSSLIAPYEQGRVTVSPKKVPSDQSVPILYQDPVTLMINFILSLPVNVEHAFFETIMQTCYNLNVTQILSRLSCGLSRRERNVLKSHCQANPQGRDLAVVLGHVIGVLEDVGLFQDDEEPSEADNLEGLEISYLEKCAQELALPFLRIASLIVHYYFDRPLPGGSGGITATDLEFPSLLQFLGLAKSSPNESDDRDGDENMDSESLTPTGVCDGLNWFIPPRDKLPSSPEGGVLQQPEMTLWLSQLRVVSNGAGAQAANQLLMVQLLWKQPRLLTVPEKYDVIFQFYHKRACRRCNRVPKDPTVCLMCGTMVCLKEPCCKESRDEGGVCETVAHAQDCGGGTGVFLAVNSSTIVVIRGKRACIWGSIYLDSFGEEDKELKRGKPLFLHRERYRLLESQWIGHKFDHTNRKWVMHRDAI